ncbi:MAG: ABC transporter substrate-binding protein [Nitrospirota bacterium]|nr:ABC transporter substrate-binding protein [Nitrospirota bacterium]
MIKKPLIAILLFLLWFLPGGRITAADDRIVILVSSNEDPFAQTVEGFSTALSRSRNGSGVEIIRLDGDAAKAGPSARKIRAGGARLVFTVGALATDAAARELSDIPVVSCLVLRTDALQQSPNMTGVGLEYPAEVQFAWMQRLLPRAKNIGILYNAGENQRTVDAAKEAAKQAGIRLETEQVRSPQDVPAALNNLSRRVDAIWGIPDSIVLSPLIAKNILLFSFRNSIPVIGPSSTWVKAGALYALDWDYRDLGGQCGEMAIRILEGATPKSIPTAGPRKVNYSINLVTARQMKLELPGQLVQGARQTY